MSYQIVDINVSQTISATPSNLQQKSAFLSFGNTIAEVGVPTLVTNMPDFNALINVDVTDCWVETNSAGTQSTIFFTYPEGTVLPPMGPDEGTTFPIITKSFYPEKYNAEFNVTQSTELDNTLQAEILGEWEGSSPSTLGTFSLGASNKELVDDITTFFAQGSNVGTYILEFGVVADAKAELQKLIDYVQEPVERIYSYQLTENISALEDTRQFTKQYEAPDAMIYFFTKLKETNDYKSIKSTAGMTFTRDKQICPTASFLWNYVSPSPSEVNRVPPMSFRYLRGVEALQAKDNVLQKYDEAFINYVGTGAEGGISNTILFKGVFGDGNDATYWYSVDWIQINVKQGLANVIINGSNNPINPLYYNQDGIDRLQIKAQQIFNTGISYGLVNPDVTGGVVVKAIPFKEYIKNNPNDYAIGRYAGLSAEYAPNRGFVKIIFNINVTLQAA